MEAQATKKLEHCCYEELRDFTKVNRVIIKGTPEEVILNYAKEKGVDLIVMGTRGLGGFKKLLLGSVSNGVVSHAPCSVLIVR